MTLTADQVYDLIKQEEAPYMGPAPHFTIDAGTPDVATGNLTLVRLPEVGGCSSGRVDVDGHKYFRPDSSTTITTSRAR